MVTYMEPQTVPSYMSVKYARRTLCMPKFTRAPHAQPFLSNISKWNLNFGKPARSHGTTRLGQNFPTSPQNQSTKLTHCSIHMSIQTISFPQTKCHAHPSWAPTKEPTVSCWRYTPTPEQDHFQDLLEAIFPDFQHTTLSKKNNYHRYSNIPQLLSAEVVLCTHKTIILYQFGLFCHQLTTISPSILNHFWWELYQIN